MKGNSLPENMNGSPSLSVIPFIRDGGEFALDVYLLLMEIQN